VRGASNATVTPPVSASYWRRLLSGPAMSLCITTAGDAQGSGFVIRAWTDSSVTNRSRHVSARAVQVKLPSGQRLPAR